MTNSSILLRLSTFLTYAAVFAVVVVLPSTFFPFIGGKYYFFRVIIEAAVACLILHWGFEDSSELRRRFSLVWRNPVFKAVTAFVGVFMLAVIFAHDFHAAFWSNYERGEGGFQMLHYYAFFVLLAILLRSEKQWKRLFWASVVAAILMISYGVGAAAYSTRLDERGSVKEYYSTFHLLGPYVSERGVPLAPTLLSRVFSRVRFQGSLGNPAYVAPYLLFIAAFLIYLWRCRHKIKLWQHALYVSGLLFFLLFFILSQTRGAFVGLIVGAAVFLLFMAVWEKTLRRTIIFSFVAIAAAGAVLFSARNSPIIQKLPGSRLLFLSFGEQTAQTRFWTWNSALKGFVKRPVLGWGPENFSAVFDKYFDPRHYVPSVSSETWFDRAHSIIFDYLSETGILGFAAYFSMFAALAYVLLKLKKHSPPDELASAPSRFPNLVRALLLAVIASYLVQGLILFDVLPIYLNLFIVFAFVVWWSSAVKKHETSA